MEPRVAPCFYLNNAAAGWPKASGVSEAVCAALEQPCDEPGRSVQSGPDFAAECRSRLAALLGVPAEAGRICFALNATQALNLAILGLDVRPGATVVTSVAEHNSVLRPLYRLRDRRSIRLEIIGLREDGALDEDAFERALQRQPALVALTHASNVTGRVFPLARMLAAARAAGAVTLLDASQSLGKVDVDAGELPADLICGNGSKGLHGPSGTGLLYVSPRLELEQVLTGGTGSRSDLERHPEEMPARLEAGTPNHAGLAGLAAALAWWQQHAAVSRAREREVAEALRAGLQSMPGVILLDAAPAERVGVMSFRIPGWDPGEAAFALHASFGIACRAGLHCAPLMHRALGTLPEGAIRFSVSGFTTGQDVEAALGAVEQLSLCRSLTSA